MTASTLPPPPRPDRTPVRISPLKPRRDPQRDRALDLRLVPGSIVAHPAEFHDGGGRPAVTAMLVERDAANALGIRDEPGVHDWFITSVDDPDDPGDDLVGTIQSFATLDGARFVRHSPRAFRSLREWIDLGVIGGAS